MTKISNLQKALASNSGKACVTVIRDDILEVLFGSKPDPDLVEGLQALTGNKCFNLLTDSCEQEWRFSVSKPQSALQVGKAIVEDLVENGLDVEFWRGQSDGEKLVYSNMSANSFSGDSDY